MLSDDYTLGVYFQDGQLHLQQRYLIISPDLDLVSPTTVIVLNLRSTIGVVVSKV